MIYVPSFMMMVQEFKRYLGFDLNTLKDCILVLVVLWDGFMNREV
jgi:hypothetical protein